MSIKLQFFLFNALFNKYPMEVLKPNWPAVTKNNKESKNSMKRQQKQTDAVALVFSSKYL